MSGEKAKRRVVYDATEIQDEPPSRQMRRKVGKVDPNGASPSEPPEPGSFADRVASRLVDLVELVEKGLPPIEYLPASNGMLLRGKRHMIAAPNKTGKSIGMLAHWVDMTLAGATVVILDRENGQDVYAKRLADIFDARGLGQREREAVREGLRYFEFPQLRRTDAGALVEHFAQAAVVVFDAQRMFLSDFDLKESESDDYAAFMSYAIDPLFRAGIATVILDNTGHKDQSRGRGTTAKGDLNEVLFTMSVKDEFDLYRSGELELKVTRSRFGNHGEWSMTIGGGSFGSWRSLDDKPDRPDFRAAVLSLLEDGKPRGQDKLLRAVRKRDVKIGTDVARTLLENYVKDPAIAVGQTRQGYIKEGS